MLDQHLVDLTADLVSLAETHRAFPVLYYFGSDEREAAHWPAVAVLDETLLLLGDLIADESRGHPDLVIDPARRAIGSYLTSLPDPYRHRPEEHPPPPVLVPLRRAGVPLHPPAALDAAVEQAQPRRARVLSVLEHQGWRWPDALYHQGAG